MNLDQQVSNCIKQSIVELLRPSKILIFGSYATGLATAESDVDIMVVVEDARRADRETAVNGRLAIRKALQAIGKDIAFDFILSSQSHFDKTKAMRGTIQCVAEQQGVVLYEQ